MNKKLSCGFVIQDIKTNLYLGCIPFGKSDGFCDIPKGGLNDGETYFECAIRELKEETGISADELFNIKELGKFSYLSNKDAYIFYAKANINLDKLHCDSTFEWYGKSVPEMSGFKLGNIDIFRKSMQKTIKEALTII